VYGADYVSVVPISLCKSNFASSRTNQSKATRFEFARLQIALRRKSYNDYQKSLSRAEPSER
jgi:hypothetical protein